MLIYVAGKYTGDVNKNIASARNVAIALWEIGHAVICPHLNSAHMEEDCKADYETYMRGDFNMISRCDALVMVENWKDSSGAKREHEYALSLVFQYTTRQNYPAFILLRFYPLSSAKRFVK